MAAETDKVKILVVADIAGQFDALFDKIASLSSQHGPFTMLLCVGRFLGGSLDTIKPYLNSEKQVPLPTFFITTRDEEELVNSVLGKYGVLCPNCVYLGRYGVREINGLQVAYFAGTTNTASLKQDWTSSELEAMLNRASSSTQFEGVDILLTNNWPQYICSNLGDCPPPLGISLLELDTFGSDAISRIAMTFIPRYHFAASSKSVFFERPPYLNGAQFAEFRKLHVTRFFGLGSAFNTKNQRWLYAFQATPLKQMPPEERFQAPPNTTSFPFTKFVEERESVNARRRSFEELETSSHGALPRFQDVPPAKRPKREEGLAEVRDDRRDRRGKQGNRRQPREDPLLKRTSGCWFCLSNPEIEKHLIVSIGDESYLALAKGGITEDHLLIIPISHANSSVSLSPEIAAEVNKYKEALRKCYAAQNAECLIFEQNLPTKTTLHMHLQVVPIPSDKIQLCQKTLESCADELSIRFRRLEQNESLKDIVGSGPYIYFELPGNVRLVHVLDSSARIPLQFGRRVVARIFDAPELEDWKRCAQSKDKELEIVSKIKQKFKAYDFTLA